MINNRFRFNTTVSQTIFAVSFAALMTFVSAPAIAEGFPGKGDRVSYAEALPHYNLGNKYLAKEWYEKAVEKYLDAINIYPYDADVYVNLSIAYRKMQNLQGAEEACRKAVELKDNDWASWSNLANVVMVQDKFSEAYKYFNKALKCEGIPPAEKAFIESDIDGMRKIMKARGLTLEGQPLASPVVPKTAGSVTNGKRPVPSKTAQQPASRKPVKQLRPTQLAGAKESEPDSNAYDKWLGD